MTTSSHIGFRNYVLITLYLSDILSKLPTSVITKVLIAHDLPNGFNNSHFLPDGTRKYEGNVIHIFFPC